MDEAARERCELRARKVMLARGLTGLIIFRPFFFSNGVQFEREKRKNEEGECSIRFDSIRFDSIPSSRRQSSSDEEKFGRMEPTYRSCSFLWRIVRRNQKGFRVNTIRTLEKFHIRIHTRIHLTGIDQERESKEEFKEKKKERSLPRSRILLYTYKNTILSTTLSIY